MPTEIFDQNYIPMLQGPATTTFFQITAESTPPKSDLLTGAAKYQKGDLNLIVDQAKDVGANMSVQTHKLFDVLVLILSSQNTYRCPTPNLKTRVSISLDEYLGICGKTQTKAAKDELRKMLSRELDLLYRISIEWHELQEDKTQHSLKIRLCDQAGIINGYIVVNFTNQMAKYLVNAQVMQYPTALLALDGRQRSAYYAGKKLAFQFGLRTNQGKGNHNLISVEKLLEVIPTIPSIDATNKADHGHWKRRIRQPLEKALDVLKENGILESWEYCLSKKKKIPDINSYFVSYEEFAKLYIHFELSDFPMSN